MKKKVDLGFEQVAIDDLRPHPRNYREHPDDQVEHIVQSIEEHGLYRNIVIARDGTILAGHGVVKAAAKMGMESIVVRRLDLDPDEPQALKLLAGDNEIAKLGMIDDRALTEILRELKEADGDGLLGTGYDEQSLAALVMVTRSATEIADFDAAAEWVGMPEYDASKRQYTLMMLFVTEADRNEFIRVKDVTVSLTRSGSPSAWWPSRDKDDLSSVKWQEEKGRS